MKILKCVCLVVLVTISFIPLFILENSDQKYYLDENNLEKQPKSSRIDSGYGYIMNLDVSYDWEEINTSGAEFLEISDDDYEAEELILPWKFEFYERNYSKVYANVDGVLSFTRSVPVPNYPHIPGVDLGSYDIVAVLWNELNTDETNEGSGTIYYEFRSDPDRVIIEYENVTLEDEMVVQGTFQVILYRSGDIKFQYKEVYNVDDEYVIGLDHGDDVNYNHYTGFNSSVLPVFSQAINFTFDAIKPIEYNLKYSEGDEFEWIVQLLNREKMEAFYGTDWEEYFGLLSGAERGFKFKIKIDSIIDNSTHWNTTYSLFNWVFRHDDYASSPSNTSSLLYRQEPLNYTQEHNLTNQIPLLIPESGAIYLMRSNLTHSYRDITRNFDNTTYLFHYSGKLINGDYIRMETSVNFGENGTLQSIEMNWENDTTNEEEIIFLMEQITPEHLRNYSFFEQLLSHDFTWKVLDINSTLMDIYFGADWELTFGIPNNPQKNQLMKASPINIDLNKTHTNLTYEYWNWISPSGSFSPTSDGGDEIEFRKEPYNYTKAHYLDNIIPLFSPLNPRTYFEVALLNQSFYNDLGKDFFNNSYIKLSSYPYNYELEGKVVYNELGILEKIDLDIEIDFGSWEFEDKALELILTFQNPKGTYIGVSEGDEFQWKTSYIKENEPPGIDEGYYDQMSDSQKILITHIGGEDTLLNRTYVVYTRQIIKDGNIVQEYSTDMYFYKKLFIDLIGVWFLFEPFLVSKDINWTFFCEELERTLDEESSSVNINITAYDNGHYIELPSEGYNYGIESRYNSAGVLIKRSVYIDDKLWTSIEIYYASEGDDDDEDEDEDEDEMAEIPGYELIWLFTLSLISIALLCHKTKTNYKNKRN